MAQLTKKEMINQIKDKFEITTGKSVTSQDVVKFLDAWTDVVVDSVLSGNNVNMIGIGILKPAVVKGRTYVSPLITKGKITKEDSKTVRLSVSTLLKKKLN